MIKENQIKLKYTRAILVCVASKKTIKVFSSDSEKNT